MPAHLPAFLRITACAAVLLPCALLGGPAWAEETDPDAVPTPGKPPEFTGGAEVYLKPVETGTLVDWVTALRGQLERLRTKPPAGPQDTQLHSAWESILEPRLGNMIGRLEKWQDPSRWVVVEGSEPAISVLKDDQWAPFVQSMSFLATELHGAWKQYQNVSIKRKNVPPDPAQPGQPPFAGPVTYRIAFPVAGLHQAILHRQAAARQLGHVRFGSHWHLLGRFRNAWDWSWEQSSTWWKYLERQQAQQARERFEMALQVALDGTRDTLNNTLLGLQAFVAATQETEQERLRGICLACKTDDATLREMAETALRDMEIVQMEAERFQGPSYSDYGSLLRQWYRRQRAAVSVLDITTKRMTDDASIEDAPKVGMAPESPMPAQPVSR
jgi:hypothetical protein